MKEETKKGERQSSEYKFADLSEDCQKQITNFEQEMCRQGYHDIALVAYQMKKE